MLLLLLPQRAFVRGMHCCAHCSSLHDDLMSDWWERPTSWLLRWPPDNNVQDETNAPTGRVDRNWTKKKKKKELQRRSLISILRKKLLEENQHICYTWYRESWTHLCVGASRLSLSLWWLLFFFPSNSDNISLWPGILIPFGLGFEYRTVIIFPVRVVLNKQTCLTRSATTKKTSSFTYV